MASIALGWCPPPFEAHMCPCTHILSSTLLHAGNCKYVSIHSPTLSNPVTVWHCKDILAFTYSQRHCVTCRQLQGYACIHLFSSTLLHASNCKDMLAFIYSHQHRYMPATASMCPCTHPLSATLLQSGKYVSMHSPNLSNTVTLRQSSKGSHRITSMDLLISIEHVEHITFNFRMPH
jgi:hypothetical protein